MTVPRDSRHPSLGGRPRTLGILGVGRGVGKTNWVLVRYRGQPLGQVIPVPAGGLDLEVTAEPPSVMGGTAPVRGQVRLEPMSARGPRRLRLVGRRGDVWVNGHPLTSDGGQVLKAEDLLQVETQLFRLKRMDGLDLQFHLDMLASSTLDSLTGLGNRSAILRQLEAQVEVVRRHGRCLSVILADLDDLKGINDRHGHGAGDRALEALAAVLYRRFRVSDLVGRVGGDEFLVVLPDSRVTQVMQVAEELRSTLEACGLDLGGGLRVALTCSLGVAEYNLGDVDGQALLARADEALYSAKTAGRNQVMAAL